MEYILTMTFLNEAGSKSSITIKEVKKDLTSEQINSLMDKIIEKDVFVTKGGKLVKKDIAKITERKVNKFEFNK